jgi:hypothetical protein
MVLDSLLGEIMEQMEESGDDENWCTQSKSPWSELLAKK